MEQPAAVERSEPGEPAGSGSLRRSGPTGRSGVSNRARADVGSIAIAALCGSAVLVATLALRDQVFDDALIHLRIARHLVEEGHPYFNLGEPVKSTSASGWTLLLAGLQVVARGLGLADPAGLICATEALAVGAGVFVHLRLFPLAAGRAFGLLGALAFAACYTALLVESAIGRMETPLAVLMAGLGVLGASRGRLWGIAALGVAPSLRIELAAVSVLAMGAAVAARSVRLVPALCAACVAALPCIAFDLAHFGTLLPHAVQAKSLVYQVTPWEVSKVLSRAMLPAARRVGGILLLGAGALITAWLVSWARAARLRGAATPPPDAALVLGLSGLAVAGAYLVGRALVFPWYAPLFTVPFAVVLFTAALRARRGGWTSRVAVCACLVLTLGQLGVLGRTGRAVIEDASQWPRFDEAARVRHYLAIGSFLNGRYPDATLLTSEIGGLGAGFRGRILDAVGLATPAALRFHPMRVPQERKSGDLGSIPTAYVRETRPELIVSYDLFAEDLLASQVRHDYVSIACPPFLPLDMQRHRIDPWWARATLYVLVRGDVFVRDAIPPHCRLEAGG